MVDQKNSDKQTAKNNKKQYSTASDDEKVARNWKKARGLYSRGEWSVAILRCATCLELLVNFAIRQELINKKGLPVHFVDNLLHNANGIHNKYNRLYLPIMDQHQRLDELKTLWREHITKVNSERNKIAHKGEFRSRKSAQKVMDDTFAALRLITSIYNFNSTLNPIEDDR